MILLHRFQKIWILTALLSVALTACQNTGRISLDEALQITADFQPTAIKQPPRTTRDVLAALDRYETAGAERMSTLQNIADTPLDTSVPMAEQIRLLKSRAEAARQLGRANQEIADLSQAFSLAQSSGDGPDVAKLELALGMAHIRAGSFYLGQEMVDRALNTRQDFADANSKSAAIVEALGRGGQLEKVDKMIFDTNEVLPMIDRMPDFSTAQREALRVALYQGKASLLDLKGALGNAELVYRSAISTWAKFRRNKTGAANDDRETARIANLLEISLAENLRRQGRFVESELASRDALIGTLKLNGRNSYQTASVLLTLAQTIFDQGRHEEATELVRHVITIYDHAGVSVIAMNRLLARSLLAETLGAGGQWDQAAKLFEALRTDLAANVELSQRFVDANASYARALMATGNHKSAISILQKALKRSRRLQGPEGLETLETGALLAAALSQTIDLEQSRSMFVDYVPKLLSLSIARGASSGTLHDRRLDEILNYYLAVLLPTGKTINAADLAESFRIVDALRGRKLAQALASSATRGVISDPVLGDLIRREQDATTQIDALQKILSDLLATSTSNDDTASISNMRSRLNALASAKLTLLDEIRVGYPQYAELIRPRPGTLEQVKALLQPDEALISTYTAEDKTYIWAVSATGEAGVHVVNIGAEAMRDITSGLRKSLDPGYIKSLAELPDYDVKVAYGLYSDILAPLARYWRNARRMIVIPHGALATLPFSLLPVTLDPIAPDKTLLFEKYRGVNWLARTHAITNLPSVASLNALRSAGTRIAAVKPFIGFGDPYFSVLQASKADQSIQLATSQNTTRGSLALRSAPQTRGVDSADLARLPRLPDTADELKSIARALNVDPAEILYLGRRADEKVVKSIDLMPYRVISFATHGLVTGDLDGLNEPALALSNPQVTGNMEDGMLTMSEILGLKLNADWAILSACNTAAAEGEGAEAVSGLGRAFFYAGARAILVSNWPVHSGATTYMMSDLFARQANDTRLTRAAALQQTRLNMIDTGAQTAPDGRELFSYAHPIFWAPFVLIGDGGGSQLASN